MCNSKSKHGHRATRMENRGQGEQIFRASGNCFNAPGRPFFSILPTFLNVLIRRGALPRMYSRPLPKRGLSAIQKAGFMFENPVFGSLGFHPSKEIFKIGEAFGFNPYLPLQLIFLV